MSGRALAMAAWAMLAWALAGCEVDPYCLNCRDSGPGTDAGPDGSVAPDGGTVDGCLPGPEICNGVDDDCDGEVDEDLAGIGAVCGTDVGPCRTGVTACVDGAIVCEGSVNPSAESCDGVDNDCDGQVDEGNPGGGTLCGSSVGECQYGITECQGGELACAGGVAPAAELCDGLDNDCDGEIDNGNPQGGGACDDGVAGCAVDVIQCRGGTLQCIGSFPMPEICDGVDNDCNGVVDDGFDFETDPTHCGGCNQSCARMNARGRCVAGACELAACLPGHWDVDGDVANGCEYVCDFRGQEICNGLDDDCDGEIDEGVTAPPICPTVGACAGAVAACMGVERWRCVFGPSVSVNAAGEIVPETVCDDIDNDCNGVADDVFVGKGSRCTRGLGECQTVGTLACNATGDGLRCAAADPGLPRPETCNGRDDDCDGVLDNDVVDAWVRVEHASSRFDIYQFEASRADATDVAPGAMTHRPCSTGNRLPWVNVTYPEAVAACAAAGARLCTEAEWQLSCETPAGCGWSFATDCQTSSDTTCNGNPFDSDPDAPGDQDALYPTGSPTFPACYAAWGGGPGGRIHDLSGNVKEWTQARGPGRNPLRGGSYNNPMGGLRCDASFELAGDAFLFANVGFRCCRDAP